MKKRKKNYRFICKRKQSKSRVKKKEKCAKRRWINKWTEIKNRNVTLMVNSDIIHHLILKIKCCQYLKINICLKGFIIVFIEITLSHYFSVHSPFFLFSTSFIDEINQIQATALTLFLSITIFQIYFASRLRRKSIKTNLCCFFVLSFTCYCWILWKLLVHGFIKLSVLSILRNHGYSIGCLLQIYEIRWDYCDQWAIQTIWITKYKSVDTTNCGHWCWECHFSLLATYCEEYCRRTMNGSE